MSIRLRSDDKTRPVMLQALRGIAEPTRVRAGCRVFEVFQSVDDPDALLLVEEWESRETMNAHIRSRDFRVVLSVIDTSSAAPGVQFDTVVSREGLELLTDLLSVD